MDLRLFIKDTYRFNIFQVCLITYFIVGKTKHDYDKSWCDATGCLKRDKDCLGEGLNDKRIPIGSIMNMLASRHSN